MKGSEDDLRAWTNGILLKIKEDGPSVETGSCWAMDKTDGQMHKTISINNLANVITHPILDFNTPTSNVACHCTMASYFNMYTMLADLISETLDRLRNDV